MGAKSSSIFNAALTGDTAAVREFLDDGTSPDAIDPQGDVPVIFYGVQIGELEIVRLLVEAGADVNVRNAYGNPPLWVAMTALGGDPPGVVRLLLEHGADPGIKNNAGKCARDYAGMIVNPQFRELLDELAPE